MARSNAAPANTPACPPLPPGSFDLNALHDAAKAGRDLEALIAPSAEAPADAPAPETPSANAPDAG